MKDRPIRDMDIAAEQMAQAVVIGHAFFDMRMALSMGSSWRLYLSMRYASKEHPMPFSWRFRRTARRDL